MTVVYNEVMIAQWINEQEFHPQNIKILQDQNLTNQKRVTPLQNILETVTKEIFLTQSEIQRELDRQRHDHDHHRHHHPSNRSGGNRFVHTAVRGENVPLLQQSLSSLESQQHRLELELAPLLGSILVNQIEIVRSQERLGWLRIHIPAAQQFLSNLSHNPALLVDLLGNRIKTVFNSYGNDHPANLLPQVRFCLSDIDNKILCLKLPGYGIAPLRQSQIEYLRLCGFLWAMHSQVQGTDFAQKIAELLEHTHIDAAGDLPFEPRTGLSAAQHFRDISSRSREAFSFSLVNFPAAERREFETLVDAQNQIPADSPMRIKIKTAVGLILFGNPSNDYFFYTKVMQSLNALSIDPNDAAAASNLCHLANSATGNPQVGKQVCGALLAIAGLLVISASMAALVTTFAAGAPLCAYGMALGYSLLQVQITCGIGWGVTTAGGIAMASSGIHLFSVNKRHGLSKELNDIGSDAKASNLRP